MARTDVVSVQAILPAGTTLTDPQVQAAINAATAVVDVVAAGRGEDWPPAPLLQIETYLAAHFAAVTDNTLTMSSETNPTCGASARYGFKFGTGMLGTPFGQMANTLSMGCLAELDKPAAGLYSIGSAGGDAQDYFL
jgi:hypothetical protein